MTVSLMFNKNEHQLLKLTRSRILTKLPMIKPEIVLDIKFDFSTPLYVSIYSVIDILNTISDDDEIKRDDLNLTKDKPNFFKKC